VRFLLDADMARSNATALRDLGHDVSDVRDIGLGSASDDEIFERAQAEQRIIVTADLDFADVRAYPPGTHAGVIVLRLPDHFRTAEVNRILETAIQNLEQVDVGRALVVVEANTIRIRRAAQRDTP
jgi:predicted nuclease of predicted toxin-antitoxin system